MILCKEGDPKIIQILVTELPDSGVVVVVLMLLLVQMKGIRLVDRFAVVWS